MTGTGNHCVINYQRISKICFRPTPGALDWARELPGHSAEVPAATVDDVVGQEHVTQTLRNAIAQNRIAHAYLFVGPRGIGKTTIARIFAKRSTEFTGRP